MQRGDGVFGRSAQVRGSAAQVMDGMARDRRKCAKDRDALNGYAGLGSNCMRSDHWRGSNQLRIPVGSSTIGYYNSKKLK
jgi:hypothetical protein